MSYIHRKEDFMKDDSLGPSPASSAALVFFGVIALALILVAIDSKLTDAEFTNDNCVKTSNVREVQYAVTSLAGKIPVTRLETRKETEWVCDSGSRWR